MNLQLGAKRIKELAKAEGLSVNKLLVDELKLSKSVVDNMIKGSVPSADKMDKISARLGASTDYLLGETDIKGSTHGSAQDVAEEDINLAKRIMALPEEDRERVIDYVSLLAKR